MKKYFIKRLHDCFGMIFILIANTAAFCQTTLPPTAQEAINKGIIAAKIPDYLTAISYFEEARKLAPQSPEVFYNLGLAESKIPGRELRAICWFGAYLNVNPAATNAEAIRELLNQLEVKNKIAVSKFLLAVQGAAENVSKTDEGKGLEDVTQLWIDFGDVAMAQKACNLISKKDIISKSWALEHIADALLEAGDIDGALKKIENMPLAQFKYRKLVIISEAQINTGNSVAAKKTLIEAVESAKRIVYEKEFGLSSLESAQKKAFSIIAGMQAKNRDIVSAQNTVDLIKTADYKSIANYEYIASAQIENGDFASAQKSLTKAIEYADLIQEPFWKAKAFSDISLAQAKSMDTLGSFHTSTKALASADLVQKTEDRSLTYSYISIARSRSGDIIGAKKFIKKALETADLIPEKESSSKSMVLQYIAEAQAMSGDLVTTFKTVDLIGVHFKNTAYYRIASAQLENEDITGALKTANLMQDDNYKPLTYWSIATDQAKNGDITGAQKTFSLIITKDVYYKIQAAVDIVQAQKKAGANSIKAFYWINKLDDKDETNVCPLNTEPFLDMNSYLKSLMNSEDAEDLFKGLKIAAENIVRSGNIVFQLLKIQMGN